MAFIKIPGLIGKVYVPEETAGHIKKHKCADCFSCQWCSDDRCCICMRQKTCPSHKNHNEQEA